MYGLLNIPTSVHLIVNGHMCKHTKSSNCTVNSMIHATSFLII